MTPQTYLDRIIRKAKRVIELAEKSPEQHQEIVIQARKLTATAESYAEKVKHK
jgi:hypothetical protein